MLLLVVPIPALAVDDMEFEALLEAKTPRAPAPSAVRVTGRELGSTVENEMAFLVHLGSHDEVY